MGVIREHSQKKIGMGVQGFRGFSGIFLDVYHRDRFFWCLNPGTHPKYTHFEGLKTYCKVKTIDLFSMTTGSLTILWIIMKRVNSSWIGAKNYLLCMLYIRGAEPFGPRTTVYYFECTRGSKSKLGSELLKVKYH